MHWTHSSPFHELPVQARAESEMWFSSPLPPLLSFYQYMDDRSLILLLCSALWLLESPVCWRRPASVGQTLMWHHHSSSGAWEKHRTVLLMEVIICLYIWKQFTSFAGRVENFKTRRFFVLTWRFEPRIVVILVVVTSFEHGWPESRRMFSCCCCVVLDQEFIFGFASVKKTEPFGIAFTC